MDNRVNAGQLDKADLSNEYIYEQALAITESAEAHGIILRLIGATAFINHCPKYNYLYEESQRKLTDVDLIAYSKTPTDTLDAMFKELGYKPIRALGWHSTTRDIYVNDQKLYIDIFRDVLSFCHPISFINRLELDFPTVSLVDLILEKAQIVQINAKDLFDVAILLLEHDFGNSKEREKIDLEHLINLWANDWGFFYTGTTNLRKVHFYLDEIKSLKENEKKTVKDKIEYLIQQVEKAPKSLKWKIRSKIGTRIRWYEEVESVER